MKKKCLVCKSFCFFISEVPRASYTQVAHTLDFPTDVKIVSYQGKLQSKVSKQAGGGKLMIFLWKTELGMFFVYSEFFWHCTVEL